MLLKCYFRKFLKLLANLDCFFQTQPAVRIRSNGQNLQAGNRNKAELHNVDSVNGFEDGNNWHAAVFAVLVKSLQSPFSWSVYSVLFVCVYRLILQTLNNIKCQRNSWVDGQEVSLGHKMLMYWCYGLRLLLCKLCIYIRWIHYVSIDHVPSISIVIQDSIVCHYERGRHSQSMLGQGSTPIENREQWSDFDKHFMIFKHVVLNYDVTLQLLCESSPRKLVEQRFTWDHQLKGRRQDAMEKHTSSFLWWDLNE